MVLASPTMGVLGKLHLCVSTKSGVRLLDRGEDLVRAVKRFLVGLIGASEDIDSSADTVDPELARVEYDDAAMVEASAEHQQAQAELAAITGDDLDDDEDC